MSKDLEFLHDILEMQEILVKLVENELCLYIDNDDNRIYCNYNTYKINERNPISETEYNKVIEFLKRKRGQEEMK